MAPRLGGGIRRRPGHPASEAAPRSAARSRGAAGRVAWCSGVPHAAISPTYRAALPEGKGIAWWGPRGTKKSLRSPGVWRGGLQCAHLGTSTGTGVSGHGATCHRLGATAPRIHRSPSLLWTKCCSLREYSGRDIVFPLEGRVDLQVLFLLERPRTAKRTWATMGETSQEEGGVGDGEG